MSSFLLKHPFQTALAVVALVVSTSDFAHAKFGAVRPEPDAIHVDFTYHGLYMGDALDYFAKANDTCKATVAPHGIYHWDQSGFVSDYDTCLTVQVRHVLNANVSRQQRIANKVRITPWTYPSEPMTFN